jgi:hypothetical protein
MLPGWPPKAATTAHPACAHYHPEYFGAFVLDPDGNNFRDG